MIRRVALALLVLAPAAARADDPRDVFGIPRKPTAEPPLDCTTGKDFGCAQASDALYDEGPFALATWLSAKYLLSLPVGAATHDQVAAYAMGAGTDDTGPSFAGATGLENRWTIDGAPADNVRTGIADTRVPLAFLDGMLVTAGGFSARDRASLGGTIDARLRRGGDHHELEAYAWTSLSASAAHPEIPSGTYQVRRGTVDPGASATVAIVATGPLDRVILIPGGRTWYALGIAPTVTQTNFAWTAARLVDKDQNGIPDGLPGPLVTEQIEATSKSSVTWSVPAMARVGLDHGAHHLEATLVGTAATDEIYAFNSTLQAAGIAQHTLVGDAIATYRGEWTNTRARVQLAWHRATRRQSAVDPAAASQPALLSTYVPTTLPEDPALAGACNDSIAGDPYPKIVQCPVPVGYFTSGGAGELVDTTADRPSLTADVARRIGHNVVRVGATAEDSRLVTDSHFTGGERLFSLFPGEQSVRHFLDPNIACSSDPTQPCATVSDSILTYRTSYTAVYAEDTFQPQRDVAVDGGLRWELMWVGPYMHFSNELSPRLGASWDPLGGGRSRVWVSMGRAFAMLPTGLGRTIIGRDRTVDDLMSPFGAGRFVDSGARISVAAGIQPSAQDEVSGGAELALYRTVRVRAWLLGRSLERGLGTTPNGFDNPGRDGGALASRGSGLGALELVTTPAAKTQLRVGYMYERTFGNYVGPYDPREGAVLYASTDFSATPVNLAGPLPTDLGHRFYVEAQRHGRLGALAVGVATRLTVGSGRPRDALADNQDGVIMDYLIPRGAAGREPLVTQANVRLAASWRGFDATLDLQNLFDQHGALNIDTIYTSSAVHPIIGGTYNDLVFLRNDDGTLPSRRTSYALANAFQPPFSAVLGVHHAF